MFSRIARFEFTTVEMVIAAIVVGMVAALVITVPVG